MSNIPEKCANCPNITLRREDIDEHNRQIDDIISQATSDVPEGFAEFAISVYHDLKDPSEPDESAPVEQVASIIREMQGEKMEELTDHVRELEQQIASFAKDCLGTLRLRGSRDGRRQVTVGVCMSPSLADGDGTEPATVTRKLL